MRRRALTYIDPRGRPSKPGPSSLELAVEEERMREEVEGYGRAPVLAPLLYAPGGFEHWKLDGEDGRPGADASVEAEATKGLGHTPASPSSFSATTTICGIDFEVTRKYFHLYEEGELWRYETLEQAIPKLEAILGAARLAANSGYQPSG
jgi:hypothetical protein